MVQIYLAQHKIDTKLVQAMAWQYVLEKVFSIGDWALLYDSRYQHNPRKFQIKWLGPYEIIAVFPNGVV